MESGNNTYLRPLASLQLIAIISVVIGHFAVREPSFMNSHWVSFCFVYSGLFTAMRHRFGPDYGLRSHARFMWDKIVKLYPLHVLALALGIFDAWYVWDVNTVNLKALFAQLTMISPWIPDYKYYFAFNPVAWFICDLFFLYLMAPLLVKLLRRFHPVWQAVIIIAMLIAEFIGGYTPSGTKGSPFLGKYLLYEFPPIRLLDFATGIVMFNLTQEKWWKCLCKRVTSATSATLFEIVGVLLFILLFEVEKTFLFGHCYRAFCVMAPGIIVLLATFLVTTNTNGSLSRALSWKPLTVLTTIGAEIYLLQYDVYFLMSPTFKQLGLHRYDGKQFILFFILLLVISWLIHRYYVNPIKKWLSARSDKAQRH